MIILRYMHIVCNPKLCKAVEKDFTMCYTDIEQRHHVQEVLDMADFLLDTLPVVDYHDDYLIYTYYHGSVVRVPKAGFDPQQVIAELGQHGLLVQPKNCPGDYSDCVELVISLTNACNLRCKYCFIGEEGCTIKAISTESIDKALLSVAQVAQRKNRKRVYIQFFGGEPTLRPDLIRYTMERAKTLLKDFTTEYGITTNGVFGSDIVDLLVDHNFVTTISMDGLPEFQDSQRIFANGAGSCAAVETSIRSLVERGIKVIIRITVTDCMIDRFCEIVDYLHSLGVQFIHFEPVTKGGRANSDESAILRPDPEKYSEKLIDVIQYAKKRNVFILTSTLMNAASPSLTFCDAVGKNKLAVTYEGLLTSCLGIQSQEHPLAEQFVMKDDDPEKWLAAQFPSYVASTSCVEKCRNCFARYICSGGCPSRNFYATKSVGQIDPMQCITTQMLLRYYIVSIYEKSR